MGGGRKGRKRKAVSGCLGDKRKGRGQEGRMRKTGEGYRKEGGREGGRSGVT